MLREATAAGMTVDDAKEKALEELGAPESADVYFEIVDLPKKKTLGLFGGKEARVRAYYDDGKAAPKAKKRVEKPAAEKQQKPAEKAEPAKKEPVQKAAAPVKIDAQLVEKTVAFVQAIVDNMNVGTVEVETETTEDGLHITLNSDNPSGLIGRRGETLDALQYLASITCNAGEDSYIRVVLDTNGYRDKRSKTLKDLAEKMAKQAQRTHRSQCLEPMNPYERRVIHSTVQGIDGVSSWSVSDGKDRRVIIGPKEDEGKYFPRNSRYGGRSSGHSSSRRSPSKGYASASQSATRDKKSDAADLPLFGRIDK